MCSITVKDGAVAHAKLTCHGIFMVGCSGQITLVEGEGRFKGISGGGGFVIRSDFADLKTSASVDPASLQSGLIYFPELKYRLP